ncbi:beta-sandwich domain of Sec23/24 [Rozella allomycis CSF55]|uniref:Beta-sandwich domain of Sec23/24 n=1 Tax=Rozella allomycis (strain CSF55) TaxID=988480 RepID=A0A075B4G8_ROZAC|nr:Sec23/Sec24, trunk domain-containing protein [Rozella allomycis CSF55]RKP18056.1 beta-sandwich domain of Sec23/24 [Rozella allomycis CSF55]|eukprot:EPZ36347.1 Sec23/Sec24, trunk domain-containing protein [Rozella allomycis CSF55]
MQQPRPPQASQQNVRPVHTNIRPPGNIPPNARPRPPGTPGVPVAQGMRPRPMNPQQMQNMRPLPAQGNPSRPAQRPIPSQQHTPPSQHNVPPNMNFNPIHNYAANVPPNVNQNVRPMETITNEMSQMNVRNTRAKRVYDNVNVVNANANANTMQPPLPVPGRGSFGAPPNNNFQSNFNLAGPTSPGSVQTPSSFPQPPLGTVPNQGYRPPPTTAPYPPPMTPNSAQNIATPNQSRPNVDPDMIPSCLTVFEQEQRYFNGNLYYTGTGDVPPSSMIEYVSVDQGNCRPQFMRLTCGNLPSTADLALASSIPLGIIIQPLAEVGDEEMPIPVVDFGSSGIVRCSTCQGYINCFVRFSEGGRKYKCNLCGKDNEVSNEYFSNLDHTGMRCDIESRPELRFGSVEFVAPDEFKFRKIEETKIVFVIDSSWQSIQSGLFQGSIEAIKRSIETFPVVEGKCIYKIGIVTFDKDITFYNVHESLLTPQMIVVSDLEDPFNPIEERFFVDPIESKDQINNLFEILPEIFKDKRNIQSCLLACLKAMKICLEKTGGRIEVFQTTLPNHGPGDLKTRKDNKNNSSENEKVLYNPIDKEYKDFAQSCASNGISIDLFISSSNFVDLGTLNVLPCLTSGSIYFYQKFNPEKLITDLRLLLQKNFGYDGLLRVRCSNEMGISDHLGNFSMRNSTDLEFGRIDCDRTIAVQLRHLSKIENNTNCYFQCAMVYTTNKGERRIRVHNISAKATTQFSEMFKSSDVDAIINFLARGSATQLFLSSSKFVRDHLRSKCIQIFSAYRKFMSASSSTSQLVLPESLKLLPIFLLSLIKSKAFRSLGESSDVRVYYARCIKNFSPKSLMEFIYPKLYPLHFLPEQVGEFDEKGKIILPSPVRLSYSRLDSNGIYILCNPFYLFLWVGQDVSSNLLSLVFNVTQINQIPLKNSLPILENNTNRQIRDVISFLQTKFNVYLPLQIVRQRIDPWEIEFNNLLIEDKNNDALDYADFLVDIHRGVIQELQ